MKESEADVYPRFSEEELEKVTREEYDRDVQSIIDFVKENNTLVVGWRNFYDRSKSDRDRQ